MTPRFAMLYPDVTLVDDGLVDQVTFCVPRVWLEAPRDGLQAVVRHRDDGKLSVIKGYDQYTVQKNGEPMGTSDLSVIGRAVGLVKTGLWIPDAEFEAVRKRLQEYRRAVEGK